MRWGIERRPAGRVKIGPLAARPVEVGGGPIRCRWIAVDAILRESPNGIGIHARRSNGFDYAILFNARRKDHDKKDTKDRRKAMNEFLESK